MGEIGEIEIYDNVFNSDFDDEENRLHHIDIDDSDEEAAELFDY